MLGDRIFYLDFYDSDLYTIQTDGSGQKKLYVGNMSGIHIAGDWIFYIRVIRYDTYEQRIVKTDGSNDRLLGSYTV